MSTAFSTLSTVIPELCKKYSLTRWIERNSHTDSGLWRAYYDAQYLSNRFERIVYALDWYGLELLHISSCFMSGCQQQEWGSRVHYREVSAIRHYGQVLRMAIANWRALLRNTEYLRFHDAVRLTA